MNGTGGRRATDLAHCFWSDFKNYQKYPNQVSKQMFKLIENFVDADLNTEYFVTFVAGYVTTLPTDQWNSGINGWIGDFYVSLTIYLLCKSVTCGFKYTASRVKIQVLVKAMAAALLSGTSVGLNWNIKQAYSSEKCGNFIPRLQTSQIQKHLFCRFL